MTGSYWLSSTLFLSLGIITLLGGCSTQASPDPADEPGGGDPSQQMDPANRPVAAPRCANFTARKRVLFGDLHIHTSYSLDSFSFANRNDPNTAYRFARGGTPATISAGEGGTVMVPALSPGLDFAAVTDHSEFLSLMGACQYGAASSPATCAALADQNSNAQASVVAISGARLASPNPEPLPFCQSNSTACTAGVRDAWQRLRDAAAAAYQPCTFSSLIGYEWTATTGGANLHRNVIFGSDKVPEVPYDYLTHPSALELWQALDRGCKASLGCQALTIPHNSNFSQGKMWDTANSLAERDFMIRYQKLVEIYQHKGASECVAGDALGDPRCSFEVVPDQDAAGYVRAGLSRGLTLAQQTGSNPLAFGFIGSTDGHNGLPGSVREDAWRGHGANKDDAPAERLGAPTFGPGGLAAVWAEQNTRESIFAALSRRETFATSGPRIAVRTYALAGVSAAQASAYCSDPNFPDQLIAAGARPMGGELPASGAPTIFVSAMADQTPLASFDIVRLRDGQTSVHSVTLSGGETGAFCRFWTDPAFAARAAAYYARVLQQPTPRWSAYDCQASPSSTPCTDGSLPATISERAWTSPIFLVP
jgi:hypothetical protein